MRGKCVYLRACEWVYVHVWVCVRVGVRACLCLRACAGGCSYLRRMRRESIAEAVLTVYRASSGVWEVNVTTSVLVATLGGEFETKTEVSLQNVDIRCRPCFPPRCRLKNPSGPGGARTNPRTFPK